MSDEEENKTEQPTPRKSNLPPELDRVLTRAFDALVEANIPKLSDKQRRQREKRFREKVGIKRVRPEKPKHSRPWTEEDERLERLEEKGDIDASIELANRDLEAHGLGRLSEEREKIMRELLQEAFSSSTPSPNSEPPHEESGEPTANKEANQKQWTQEIENDRQESLKNPQR